MGFWYILLLLIGISFLVIGALKKEVSLATKMVIILFVLGVFFVGGSLFMLMPGSDEIISELLELN
ncbi:membrane-bound ClpP family serine protease [Planomicrobium koreense]|uniref:Membrane-bound ClpP family serine protease n=1 Tax=Planococcus koreensis TaxID=112331 RepID=A0A7W8CUW5_9BACL|nr:hypothetical protein [Planococcus koreensis]MBB5180425.1 membrane-bound ClpP family serine protease [Planococcus koreensis]